MLEGWPKFRFSWRQVL